ncbi:hypothetical protein [Ammoniphilus oxalaticus]|uniref:hypothetical protein n=1 Tax=Ammoniphilus oxalaticus TaxID=66863 RepID=UPI001474D93B|nr:hypothetical protein [Ammoniphilus oxalaticus]
MKVIETQVSLVALTFDEIETIISALESDFHEWGIEEAGILLGQFKKAKEKLSNKE